MGHSIDPNAAARNARRGRRIFAGVAMVAIAIVLVASGTVRAAWQEIAQFLSLVGEPEPASANVLSEHELEVLDRMTPQQQAELLLERSINHYRGANEQIAARVNGWKGRIEMEGRLEGLFTTALNSGDLRVRAAAIEVNIVARNLEKTGGDHRSTRTGGPQGEQGPRANALWDLGLLGNRGVEPERAAEILLASRHDPNENIRYWAIEGLAYLGTDGTIAPLLESLRDDPSPLIRERAACSLAQSGMLSERQRRRAVPRLLELAGDGALDDQTRKWVFQALRDVTGQNLPPDVRCVEGLVSREQWRSVESRDAGSVICGAGQLKRGRHGGHAPNRNGRVSATGDSPGFPCR